MRKFGQLKVNKDGSVLWRCNHRPKVNPCPCYVRQDGATFSQIKLHSTSCISITGLDLQLQLLRDAKQTALQTKELLGNAIVEFVFGRTTKLFSQKYQTGAA